MEKSLTKNVKESRQVLRVLYEVMVHYNWTDIDEEVLVRLLTMYYHSIHPTQDDEFFYPTVRKGLELLLRAMFQNFPSTYLMKSVGFSAFNFILFWQSVLFLGKTNAFVGF